MEIHQILAPSPWGVVQETWDLFHALASPEVEDSPASGRLKFIRPQLKSLREGDGDRRPQILQA